MIRKPRIALALGSGSSRGWAHIGAIRALEEHGIKFDLICGTSVGALVGAVHASGQLNELEQWVTSLVWRKVGRTDPAKLVRRARAVVSRLHPSLRLGVMDGVFPATRIDFESRPYHLGWILYAWTDRARA